MKTYQKNIAPKFSYFIAIFCLLITSQVLAQEDLLNQLEQEAPKQTTYTTATFKSTRLINSHTIENTPKNHLDVRFSHRFGPLANDPLHNYFGLTNASVRLAAEYGIIDRLMVGYGWSSMENTMDLFAKAKILRQSKGEKKMPISVTGFASVYLTNARWANPDRKNYFTSRLSYALQAIIARKFGERFSLQIMPIWIHKNLVELEGDKNDIFSIGIGGRVKITKRFSILGEYFFNVPGQYDERRREHDSGYARYFSSGSFGAEFETGGHVFQFFVSNSMGLAEPQVIAKTDGAWYYKHSPYKSDLRLGFNIMRVISFDKKAAKLNNTAPAEKSPKPKKSKKE